MELIMTGIDFFHKGGPVMYLLLLCSMFVVAIGIERALHFNRMDSGRDFARVFYEQVTASQYGEAAALLQNAHGVLAKIIIAAVQKENREQAAHYMELQSGIVLSRMRQRLYYLSVIVTMAPLLGLLGTISGMISSFSVFNVASGQATAITGGVGEALIATAMGLCVAIAALAVHAYFSQRLENIITDMEQCFSLVEEHLVHLHGENEHAAAGQLVMEGGTL